MASSKNVFADALKLPLDKRARLAQELLASLDQGKPDADAEARWASEIERRLRQIDEGTAKLHDWREVRRSIETALRATGRARSSRSRTAR